MNAVSLLDQSVIEGSTGTSKSSSFSVRDILELPSSQQNSYSTGNLTLRSNYRSVSSTTSQMIAHDLYPQNSLRHLPLSAGAYQQQEDRQFQDRFSYSPQYTESRSTSTTEPSFSFVQDNQQSFRHQSENQQTRPVLNSSLSVHHGINMDSNSHLSAIEKRVHSVESLPEMSTSTSPVSNIQSSNCSTSYSSGILGKNIKTIQNPGDEAKNDNFVNSIPEESHYPSSVDFSAAKEKYPLGVEDQIPADFPSSSLLRKSENDVFLPDDNSTSEKTSNWPKMEDNSVDMKYKGKNVRISL